MYNQLKKMQDKPRIFDAYTAARLWNDPHISKQMLAMHLDPEAAPASRPKAFVDQSIEWIVQRFDVGPRMRIADFGCGPGLYAHAFAQKGAVVTGIDFSKRSIAHATQQADKSGLDIDYINRNYLDFFCDREFDLITLIYCDFCALSPAQRQQLLDVFRGHLAKGGAVLFDVFSLAAYAGREESTRFEFNLDNGFWSPNPYFGFQHTFRYDTDKVVLDKYTIVEENHSVEVFNWLQYFSLDHLEHECKQAGFDICDTYGDVAGAPLAKDCPTLTVILKTA